MSNQVKWGIVAVMVLIVTIILVTGIDCGGNKPKIEGYVVRKAQAYQCEETGERFGLPLGAKVFPPIVNPKTGKRTLVRAHVFISKTSGEPKVLWYEKFTDEQIKAMEKYVKNTPPEIIADMPPDTILSEQTDGPLIKKPGGQWTTFRQRLDDPRLEPDTSDAKTIFEVYPENWGKILKPEQIKQW